MATANAAHVVCAEHSLVIEWVALGHDAVGIRMNGFLRSNTDDGARSGPPRLSSAAFVVLAAIGSDAEIV
jgi:hypothetical protein